MFPLNSFCILTNFSTAEHSHTKKEKKIQEILTTALDSQLTAGNLHSL